MAELSLAVASAFCLGMQTVILPCPLTANLAAISYIGRRLGSPRHVLLSGLLYTLGQSAAYACVAILIVSAAVNMAALSGFFQFRLRLFVGPLLVLVGMLLLGMLQLPSRGGGPSERFQRRVDALGMWGALPLGAVLALSFCPVSAGLFFGLLIPLAVRSQSRLLVPFAFGLGTALPVVFFTTLLAVNAKALGKAYGRTARVEAWARQVFGVLLLVIGVYLTLVDLFHVDLFGIFAAPPSPPDTGTSPVASAGRATC